MLSQFSFSWNLLDINVKWCSLSLYTWFVFIHRLMLTTYRRADTWQWIDVMHFFSNILWICYWVIYIYIICYVLDRIFDESFLIYTSLSKCYVMTKINFGVNSHDYGDVFSWNLKHNVNVFDNLKTQTKLKSIDEANLV